MYFYLVQCEDKNTHFLDEFKYIHIKAKTDGSEITIISDLEIIYSNVVTKTQPQLQTIIDGWIDIENTDPPLDENENEILQSPININCFKRLLDV